jgi:hypothetical protein
MSARKIGLLSVLLLMSACAGSGAGGSQGPSPEGMVPVAVQNGSNSSVRIYAVQGGHMVPLGLAAGMGGTTLSLPGQFLEAGTPVELVADVIGGAGWHKMAPVSVGPSSRIEVFVGNPIERSTVTVR